MPFKDFFYINFHVQFFEYTDLVDNDVVKVKENVLVEHGFNSPFERVEVYNVDILVPDVPPSDSTSSKVIRLSYKLRVMKFYFLELSKLINYNYRYMVT